VTGRVEPGQIKVNEEVAPPFVLLSIFELTILVNYGPIGGREEHMFSL
jgi:hypothetical protein